MILHYLQIVFNVSEYIFIGVHFTIICYVLNVLMVLFASKANIKSIECFMVDDFKSLV